MRFAVTIVTPPGYVHSEAFLEVAQSLHYALRALGHESLMTRTFIFDRRKTIVLGSNLLATMPSVELPPQSILYNLEQVQTGSAWMKPALIELFKKHPVWDYSKTNIAQLVKLGVPEPKLLPIGYSKELTRIPKRSEDIDVLFYGCINDRRRVLLEALIAAGLKVEVLFGVYGAKRDEYIARSKLVLNLHFYEAKVFEVVRVSYLLANERAVVSETGVESEEEASFASGIAFSPYEQLVHTCLELVRDDERRKTLARTGFELMSRRSERDYLHTVLTQSSQGVAA